MSDNELLVPVNVRHGTGFADSCAFLIGKRVCGVGLVKIGRQGTGVRLEVGFGNGRWAASPAP